MPKGAATSDRALVLCKSGLSPLGPAESPMTKVAVSEALLRIADRCGRVMGGTGVTGDTIAEQVFREVRAFRIHDGPTGATNGRSPRRSSARTGWIRKLTFGDQIFLG